MLFLELKTSLCKVINRTVYSVCKLHNPQTRESKANQKEKWRLATRAQDIFGEN